MVAKRKTKKLIHINQQILKANRISGENKPVITVKASNQNIYGHEVTIFDSTGKAIAYVVYSPDAPLSCGAVCWIETFADVQVTERRIVKL